jgi:hypothetical protein
MKIKFQPTKTEFRFEIAVLIYFFLAFIIFRLPMMIKPLMKNGNLPSLAQILQLVDLPTVFLFSNLLAYAIFKKHIILRVVVIILVGVVIAIVQFVRAPGIINPVYFFILSSTCAIIIGLYKGAYIDEQFQKITNYNEVTEKLIDYLRDSYKYILGKAFQGWLALGASVGISMSILFRGGYEDVHLKFMALKMLVGFIFISVAIGYWIAVPMLNGILSIQEKLQHLKVEKNNYKEGSE